MANELVAAFERASADDDVRAVVVTGRGRAFCAGMDLSVGGNVFGLDESQEPTLSDLHDRLDDPAILDGVRDTGGRVTLAIYACTKPVIAAINGPAVGIGATMTLAMDVRMASIEGPDRPGLRQDRHRPRGLLDLVPAAHRRHQPGARARLLRRHPRRRGRPRGRPGPVGARARRAAARGVRAGPEVHRRTAPRWRPRWPAR